MTRTNRRTLLIAAGVAPLAALAPRMAISGTVPAQTKIQRLYGDWLALTDEYNALDAEWKRCEFSSSDFEELADPIFERRDEIEEQIFAVESQTMHELAIKMTILAHFEWLVTPMQESLSVDAARFIAPQDAA